MPDPAPQQPPDPYLVQRKDEILAAARNVFVRRGFEGATMQEIADEAGISAGGIYRYFPSKASLVTSVCADAGDGYMSAFEEDGSEVSALATLTAGGAAIWESIFGPDSADSLRMNLEATIAGVRQPDVVGAPLAATRREDIARLTAVVSAAQADGELQTDFEPELLATILVGVMQGMQLLHGQLQGGIDDDGTWRLLVRMVNGLAAPEHQLDRGTGNEILGASAREAN
jgi:AcrR family transcriptional regulator